LPPSALAPYGTTALIGWGVMAFGAICLGMVFARGTIYGAGADAGMWALIMVLLATPIWVYLKNQKQTDPENAMAVTDED
jgi:hypothetical protein